MSCKPEVAAFSVLFC